MSLEYPEFIDNDPEKIISEMKAFYEAETEKTLPDGAPEMLLINMCAARESTLRSKIQSACLRMLLAFSSAPMLDHLGLLVGAVRLSPSVAQTTLTFTLTGTHGDLILPGGTRVQTTDGKFIFETVDDIFILAGTTTKDINAWCTESGTVGNGYAIGSVSNLLNALPYVVSVQNSTVTSGGANMETDDQFRERIQLAPNSFSTAGPDDAYIYFARSASPAIIDVAVASTVPGTVEIYPMIEGGTETPPEVINLVIAACNSKKIRPLTDTLIVESPDRVDFDLVVNITKISGALNSDIETRVNNILVAFLQESRRKLGRNITIAKLTQLCMYDDTQVYDVNFGSFVNLDIAPNEFAFCETLTINITGEIDE